MFKRQSSNPPLILNDDNCYLIHFRFVYSKSPSPGMGELNISPPWGEEKRVSMVQIYIYGFIRIADLESLCKMEHFVSN